MVAVIVTVPRGAVAVARRDPAGAAIVTAPAVPAIVAGGIVAVPLKFRM